MTAIYDEPLIIPQHIAKDRRLNWTEKVAFSVISKYHGQGEGIVNAQVADFLNVTIRHAKKVKSRLASFNHLLKVQKSRHEIRYVPINSHAHAREMIGKLLERSRFFKGLRADEIWRFEDPVKLYRWMSALELQYRNSNKRCVHKPYELLFTCYYKKGSPPKIEYNWFLDDEEKAQAERKRKAQARKVAERAAKEKQAYHDFTDNVLQHMTKKERADLRKRAREVLKSNGGAPDIGGETTIRRTMFELWRSAK